MWCRQRFGTVWSQCEWRASTKVTESLLRWLHQSKTGLQKYVMSFSKITIIVCTPPFNKTHLKVLAIACCATGYYPGLRCILIQLYISASLCCRRCIQTTFSYMSCGPSGRYYLMTTNRARLHAAIWEKARENTLSSRKSVFKSLSNAWGKLHLLAVWKRLKLNDLFSLASCQCCSEIQCYKTSRHSRRAGGEKRLVSLWLELISGGQAGLPVHLELILLFGLQVQNSHLCWEKHML